MQTRQVGDEVVGESLGEIRLLRIAAEVAERQHGEGVADDQTSRALREPILRAAQRRILHLVRRRQERARSARVSTEECTMRLKT